MFEIYKITNLVNNKVLGIPRHLIDRRFHNNNSCIIGNYKIDILG